MHNAQVCTVFLMRLDDNRSSMGSCAMLDRGELSLAQVTQMGLDCDEVRSTQHAIVVMMSLLLAQLWLTCLLSKTYMEMVQAHDRGPKAARHPPPVARRLARCPRLRAHLWHPPPARCSTVPVNRGVCRWRSPPRQHMCMCTCICMYMYM